MDTLHTVLNRGCSLWDQTRMPKEEFLGRLSRIREGMRERGIDLILVYGDSWRFGHLAFVSHFMPKNRGALAMIPLEGEPALVVQEPSRNNPFSKTLTWIDEVHSVGQFAQGLGEALKARGLKPERVGLVSVKEQLPLREWQRLGKILEGAELGDFSDSLSSLRRVKSACELSLLREASRILAEALSLFEKEAKAGQKEYEIMALLERAARRRGVEDFRFLLARSANPQVGLRPAGPAPLRKGEVLFVAVAASYQRYWAEVGRTFFLGEPPPGLVKNFGLAKDIFHKLVESVKAGSVPAAAGAWLKEIPSLQARDSLQAYGLGNGIGLDLTEEPLLGKDGPVRIQSGMVLTLRVCLLGSGDGGALISQPFRVAPDSLESLVTMGEEIVWVRG